MGYLLMRREEKMKTMMINKILRVLAVFFFCLTTFTAGAANIADGTVIYLDVTSYPDIQQSIKGKKTLQVLVGHDGWSEGYVLNNVSGYENLYSVTMPKWEGCTKLAFMTADNKWTGKDEGVASRVQWGYTKTTVFNVNSDISGDATFARVSEELKTVRYVAGNGSKNNPWCDGQSWNTVGSMFEVPGSITFNSVPAGTYEFKITNGTWNNAIGSDALDKENSTKNDCRFKDLGEGSDKNVKFTITETADITIGFNNSKITVTASFATPMSYYYVLMGIGGDWGNGEALEVNPDNDAELMLLNQQIDNKKDAVKIVKLDICGNKIEYEEDVDVDVDDSPCSEKVSRDDKNNIKLPDGVYDFYYRDGEIYITPSESNVKYYLMGVDTDGNGETSDNWEADSNYELTPSQEPGKENELVLLGATISATNSMKIVKKTPCGDDYYADVKIESPVPYGFVGDGNIVLDAGTYDFYFEKGTGKIYIGGTLDNAKVVHLDPKAEDGSDWEADGAQMAVHYRNSDTDNGWVTAEKCNTYYFAQIPEGYTEYYWVRMNPNRTENRWNSDGEEEGTKPVWNQSSGIKYDAKKTLTIMKDMEWDCYQTVYSGICGENFNNLNCTFPEAKDDTVFVHINQFVDSDPCNYIFRSFEQAFAVLKTNNDICTSSTITLGGLKEDVIDFTKHVVMLVHFGPAYYRGTEKVGMSGGHIGNAPAIFFRNINQNSDKQLVVRTADPKGNRAVLVHPVIRRSKNIVLDNLDIISDKNLRDNALDIDTGKGDETLEYTDSNDKNFNIVPLPVAPSNITLKNCYVESYGRNGIHIVGIKGLHVENNEFYTKYDFTGSQSVEEKHDVVDWGGTIKLINCTDVKFLRNNSEGTLATSFFIQGCQRVLIMNNVFWNDNKVEVPGLSGTGRTVANVRLVNYVDDQNIAKAGDFPVKNIGVYYNTFFIRSNDSESAKDSYVTFDFFRLGGLEQPVRDNNAGNKYYDPETIRFQYNNCYSYDADIEGNNDDEKNTTTFYLQGIGKSTEWCKCFKYNNFWSAYDKINKNLSSAFEVGKFCVDANETYNAFINVPSQVCNTDPKRPGALVVKEDGLNIGTLISEDEDVSEQGAHLLFNDRLNPDNGVNSIRPQMAVDNSNESLVSYDKIYKEPGSINLYTSPIVASQSTDVHVSSLKLVKNSKVNLRLVDAERNLYPNEPKLFALTDKSGKNTKDTSGKNTSYYFTTDEKGTLDNEPIYITFLRPEGVEGVEDEITYEVFLEIVPEQDDQLVLLIPIRGHYVPKITKIGGAWTIGAFQQRQAMPVDTIVWHGSESTEWDNRNNWYKTDGTLVTCLDALTEDLTVIIPNKDSEKYVTPPAGISQYPELPDEISNDTDFKNRGETWKGEQVNAGNNETATEVAHKIFMEYGAALVGVENLGENRYSEAEVEFTARRKDWLLVGSVVKPWELDEEGNQVFNSGEPKTRDFKSGDYYLNHLPHVYMHQARIDTDSETGDLVVNWNESFAPLDVDVDPQKVFAIRLPNQYGPKKWPASIYNNRNGSNYDGDKPHTYSYKGRFYNETDIPRYTNLEPGKPTLLTNTYPANIDADELKKKGYSAGNAGTYLIYDYDQESFVPVGNRTDAVILSQHGFVFTPANNQLAIGNEYFLNNETGHRSLTDDILSLRLRVKNEKASVSSEVYISYDEFKEDKVDYAVDAPKVFNDMVKALPEVYVMRYDKNWAALSIPEITKPIPLGVRDSIDDPIFKFTLVDSNLPFDVILEDRKERKTYNLSAGETCEVSDLVKGKCEGRFYINLRDPQVEELPEEGGDVTTDVEELDNSGIDIYTDGNRVTVSSTSDVELQTVMVTDISGRHQVYNVSGQYITIDLPVSTGVYTISVIGDKASRIEKLKLN